MAEQDPQEQRLDMDQLPLKGFSRGIAEIHWLLLLLVMLYHVVAGEQVSNPFSLVLAMVAFAIFVLLFHYVDYDAPPRRWKLVLETGVMIAFVSWALWHTGRAESPLLGLYLLAIVASGLTLGRLITFLEIGLIALIYLFMLWQSGVVLLSLDSFTRLMIHLVPLILVAYTLTMLTAEVRYGKKLFKSLSETDEMTGLLNKRLFRPMFGKAAEVAVKYAQPLSLMVIDVDGLKGVNELQGHKAGDRMIFRVARTIEECLRTSDIICRYEGDEFVALLPQVPAERAAEAAERLRAAIAEQRIEVDGESLQPTVSIGVATYPDDVLDVYELLDRADEALHESKYRGRNRVTHHGDICPPRMQVARPGAMPANGERRSAELE